MNFCEEIIFHWKLRVSFHWRITGASIELGSKNKKANFESIVEWIFSFEFASWIFSNETSGFCQVTHLLGMQRVLLKIEFNFADTHLAWQLMLAIISHNLKFKIMPLRNSGKVWTECPWNFKAKVSKSNLDACQTFSYNLLSRAIQRSNNCKLPSSQTATLQ